MRCTQVALAQLQVRKAGMDAEAAAARNQQLERQLQVCAAGPPLLASPEHLQQLPL